MAVRGERQGPGDGGWSGAIAKGADGMKKPIAAIPEPPRDASPALKAMLSAIKEALEVRLVRRGDPLEEAITKRELVESGIAKIRSQAAKSLEPVTQTPAEANIIPPAPVGLTAIGMFGGVQLSWENP